MAHILALVIHELTPEVGPRGPAESQIDVLITSQAQMPASQFPVSAKPPALALTRNTQDCRGNGRARLPGMGNLGLISAAICVDNLQ